MEDTTVMSTIASSIAVGVGGAVDDKDVRVADGFCVIKNRWLRSGVRSSTDSGANATGSRSYNLQERTKMTVSERNATG